MNKKLSIAALALAGVVALSGCTVSPTYPAPSQTEAPAPAPAPVRSDERQYLDGLKATGNSYALINSDYDLVDAGRSFCEALDAGVSLQELISATAETVPGDEEWYQFVGFQMAASLTYLCPEYAYMADSL